MSGDVGDTPASGGQGHALPRTNGLAEIELRQGIPHRGGDILYQGPLEMLADADHLGIQHGNAPGTRTMGGQE